MTKHRNRTRERSVQRRVIRRRRRKLMQEFRESSATESLSDEEHVRVEPKKRFRAVAPNVRLNANGSLSAWPCKSSQVADLVKNLVPPGEDWPRYKVKVIGKTDSYERAREIAASFARRRKRPKRLCESQSETENFTSEDETNILHPTTPPSDFSDTFSVASSGVQQSNSNAEDGALKTLLRMVLEIREDIKIIKAAMTSKMERDIAISTLPMEFPLKTLPQLTEWECRLRDSATRDNLVIAVKDIGGKSVKDFVKRAMTKIMETSLARQCNLSGRNNKYGLGESSFSEILFRASKQNKLTADASRRDVELELAKWLLGARDRDGGRRKRMGSFCKTEH